MMNAGRLAMVALSIESYEAAWAKERQAATQYGGGINVTTDSDHGKARDKAAAAVGASPSYVQQAKKVQAEAPTIAYIQRIKDIWRSGPRLH